MVMMLPWKSTTGKGSAETAQQPRLPPPSKILVTRRMRFSNTLGGFFFFSYFSFPVSIVK